MVPRPEILLIGADGTLGTAFSGLLAARSGLRWTQRDINLTDSESIEGKIRSAMPRILINAAAYTNVDGAETDETLANAINGTAVREMARACNSIGARFVHFSTDYVFDGTTEDGYREDDAPKPLGAYGRSKLLGEQFATDELATTLIIRTSRLYGLASSPTAKKNFVVRMLELAADRPEVKVVDDERTSPTYAPDLAQAALTLVDSGATGIYHRSNDRSCTWREFATEIFAQAGKQVAVRPVPGSTFPRAAQRPRNSTLISTKAPVLRPWQTALADYLSMLS